MQARDMSKREEVVVDGDKTKTRRPRRLPDVQPTVPTNFDNVLTRAGMPAPQAVTNRLL